MDFIPNFMFFSNIYGFGACLQIAMNGLWYIYCWEDSWSLGTQACYFMTTYHLLIISILPCQYSGVLVRTQSQETQLVTSQRCARHHCRSQLPRMCRFEREATSRSFNRQVHYGSLMCFASNQAFLSECLYPASLRSRWRQHVIKARWYYAAQRRFQRPWSSHNLVGLIYNEVSLAISPGSHLQRYHCICES